MIAPLGLDGVSGPCVGDSVLWVDGGIVGFGPVVDGVILGVIAVLSLVTGGSVTLEGGVVVEFAVGSGAKKI